MRTVNFLYELNRNQYDGTLLNIDKEQSPVVICSYKIKKKANHCICGIMDPIDTPKKRGGK